MMQTTANPSEAERDAQPLHVRTRYGSKVHLAYAGSSVTFCGVWLRAPAQRFRVDAPVTCRHCGAGQATTTTDNTP